MKPLIASQLIKGTVRFTVRPRPHSPYRYDVLVFAGEKKMVRWAWMFRDVGIRSCLAACITNMDVSFDLGDLLFTRRQLTPELITHEATHAAHNYYAKVRGQRRITVGGARTTPGEEYVADAAGHLVADITRNLRKRGLLNGSD